MGGGDRGTGLGLVGLWEKVGGAPGRWDLQIGHVGKVVVGRTYRGVC